MAALLKFFPFALEGQWQGAAAVALVLVGVVIFVGTIYILLVSIYGWYQGYLVTMTALSAFSVILSAMWLFGIPGTIPGTGPRGTEPYWAVFTADSEQGQEFSRQIREYPKGWRTPNSAEMYPGQINAEGEIDNIKNVLFPALAGHFQKQKTGPSDPEAYEFRLAGRPAALGEDKVPQAKVLFHASGTVVKTDPETKQVTDRFQVANPPSQLLVAVEIPAVTKGPEELRHPAIRVFGYRNKGRVFQASAEWLTLSVLLFALHLWLLGRYEKAQTEREQRMASGSPAPQPANV